MRSVGRKFLVAGKSGLNLTSGDELNRFLSHYRGNDLPDELWRNIIASFDNHALRNWAAGLGVEEPWSKAWAAHLARVSPDRKHDYHPTWYRGRSWTPDRIGSATAASVAAVSAAMASAMPQPKSSSGSSGGGFSGGGGGGGGGGGW